jgi:hypothetical protein
LAELERDVDAWMATSGHACGSDPRYPSIVHPDRPVLERYRPLTETRKEGEFLAGFEAIDAGKRRPVLNGQAYVLRRHMTLTKSGKSSTVDAPFPSVIDIKSVTPDKIVGSLMRPKLGHGATLLLPGTGLPGSPMMEFKDPANTEFSYDQVEVAADDLLPLVDYLDLMTAALGRGVRK